MGCPVRVTKLPPDIHGRRWLQIRLWSLWITRHGDLLTVWAGQRKVFHGEFLPEEK